MRTPKQYEIILHVDSLALSTVLDVVKDCATIAAVRQLEAGVQLRQRAPRTNTRIKGTTTADVCLAVLADGRVHTDDDLAAALSGKGFSPTSAHPAMSTLIRDGKAKRITRGRYCLATVTHLVVEGSK